MSGREPHAAMVVARVVRALLVAVSMFTIVANAQSSITYYVNPQSSGSSPTGTATNPYASLAQAWTAASSAPAGSTVTLFLASGVYTIPKTQITFPATLRLAHAPTVPGTTVQVTPEPLLTGDAELAVPNIVVPGTAGLAWTGISFVGFTHSGAGTGAAWSVMSATDSAAIALVNCTVTGSDSAPSSSFRVSASDSASVTVLATRFAQTRVELAVDGAAGLAVRDSAFTGVKPVSKSIVAAAGSAQVVLERTSVKASVGTVFGLSSSATLQSTGVTLSQISCESAAFGIITINDAASATLTGASITDISAAQGASCASGLLGLFDTTQLTLAQSTVADVHGRLIYGDGTSTATLADSSLARVAEVDGVQYLISMRTGASVVARRSTFMDVSGSWIAIDSSLVQLVDSVLTNTVCPASKSFWLFMAGSARFSMAGSTITGGTRQSKPCMMVQGGDATTVALAQSTIKNLVCRTTCVQCAGGCLTTMDRVNITGVTVNEPNGIVSLLGSQPHVLSGVRASGNGGGTSGTANVITVTATSATIDASRFEKNLVPALGVSPSASVVVTNSVFAGNAVPAGYGGAIVNEGTLAVAGSNFSGNAAKLGGAVYHASGALTVTDSAFTSNLAGSDGGALYIAATPAVVNGTAFRGNRAKRGGAWFAPSPGVATGVSVNDARYAQNAPADYASSFHALVPGAGATAAGLTVRTGGTLNTSVTVRALDVFRQPYVFGGLDTVLLVRATSPSLKLTGETTQAVFTGSATFKDLQVYGDPGTHVLHFGRVGADEVVDTTSAVVSVAVTVEACPNGTHVVQPSLVYGTAFPVCTAIACPLGCLYGTCASAGNCTCAPGYDGIACDLRANAVDTLTWRAPAAAFPVFSVGVRDALMAQARAVLARIAPPGTTAQFRFFTQQRDGGGVELKFAVLDDRGQVVQADALGVIARRMAGVAESTKPVASSFGFAWPPPPQSLSSDVAPVAKLSVSPAIPEGTGILLVYAASVALTLSLWAYVAVRHRAHPVVRTSSRAWLTEVAVALVLVHVWIMLGAAVPTSAACQAQFAVGVLAAALTVAALVTKTAQFFLVCENPILSKLAATSPTAGVPLVAINAGAIALELVLAIGWLASATASPRVNVSPATDASYWQCTLGDAGFASPGALVFIVANAALVAVSLIVQLRSRRAFSLSEEPRILFFVQANIVGVVSVLAAVQAVASLDVVVRYVVQAFVVLLALHLASGGFLGYKAVVIRRAAAGQGSLKRALHAAAAVAAAKPKPTAGGPALTTAPGAPAVAVASDGTENISVLDQSNLLASSLVPIRRTHPLAQWRLAFLEVAKEYHYLSVTCGNDATFYALPCEIVGDAETLVLDLRFKSGARLHVQARDAANLAEWERTLRGAGGVPATAGKKGGRG
ncbi:hypothetical protein H9P43_008413 [Blastocladiella emersonii ATCC 22665]|nr:hypothetical protein H9P43_008413 [Blastocladiella emersonii ATCC 22665]